VREERIPVRAENTVQLGRVDARRLGTAMIILKVMRGMVCVTVIWETRRIPEMDRYWPVLTDRTVLTDSTRHVEEPHGVADGKLSPVVPRQKSSARSSIGPRAAGPEHECYSYNPETHLPALVRMSHLSSPRIESQRDVVHELP
jgi:hypothetical protein